MADAPSKASEWKQANRKLVELPSGRTVKIRKLTAEFIMVLGSLFENLIAPDDTGAKSMKMPLAEQRRYIQLLITESAIDPRIRLDAEAASDEELNVSDLGVDLDALVKAIHDWNGEVLKLGGTFRGAEDGSAIAPAGEDLRGEPVGVAEEALAGSHS